MSPRDRCRVSVERNAAELITLSRSLHAEPETAFQEFRSAEKVARVLEDGGFRVERGAGGLPTAFTATYGSGRLVAGLCAEYDALPGMGHACGHNIIAAASAGAALALREVADELDLTVKLLGTPAEESGGGKIALLEQGVFDDVAMAMMVHPSPDEVGAPASLAIMDLRVRFSGRASHAALAPHLGVNAADALTIAQVAVGLLRQHLEPGQLVHGIVTDAGAAPNIVPAEAGALFELRAPDVAALHRLETRVRACLAAGAMGTGCTHEVDHVSPIYAELTCDGWLADAYCTAVAELGRRPLRPAEGRPRIAAGTDMGNVSRVLPVVHPTIAIDCGDAVNHQPEFAAACATPSADRAVLDGALALAWTAVAAAADEEERARLLDGVARRA
ncbi:amidohydrolase [Actinomadura craniellae]|uniref:Peptidase M20 domain-containing protein 2 n=1 Tax=Actinomadura craniellae TaxID=2231787 RepID=A0A365HAH1_9ACTN|nr:M20 family metallopeptidase [Actinomadura craniellae]RAY16140.1 amidohydrolase [Actinomadura craniellae]